ncbi:hypothetical protein AFK24_07955 [Pseudomonas syringae]|uniref:Uncharacterized protein n=1 Tax=Pseudomonas syringae TaxID=317 RepID=A0A1C7Z8Y3_PSESX|nr:hypothetical protein [Pseudomonas syringae]OCR25650.1 hypothetical protein AFK24_07955 [Pseudomonas syringae]
MSAALTITRNQILVAQKQQKALLDQTADLFDSVIAARTQASSYQSFIQELVSRVNPHFQEIQIIWQVFTAAQRVHGLTEATLAYITVLREECGRRFDGSIDELISRCEQSDLLLGEANRYFAEHPTATFLAHRETLVRDVTRVERLGGEYSIALEDIKELPGRVFDKYVKRMRLYLLGALFPLVNMLCVGLLVRDLERLQTALVSRFPSFVSLRRQFEKVCILLACMSVLCAGLLLFQGENFENMGANLFGAINPTFIKWGGVYCYLVSLAMSLWSLTKLRRLPS